MGFFELDLQEDDAISKDYFSARALSILTELSHVDFEFVSKDVASFYSKMFAEAKERNAMIRRDIAPNNRKKEYWISEHERWEKANLQAKGGDITLLAWELKMEAGRCFSLRNHLDEMAIYGMVLSNLSEILEPEESTK